MVENDTQKQMQKIVKKIMGKVSKRYSSSTLPPLPAMMYAIHHSLNDLSDKEKNFISKSKKELFFKTWITEYEKLFPNPFGNIPPFSSIKVNDLGKIFNDPSTKMINIKKAKAEIFSDISETEDEIIIILELPGVEKKDFKITTLGKFLEIETKPNAEKR